MECAAQHGTPGTQAGNTNWLTIGAVVFALLFGTISLMSSIVFSFQRYFEYQVEEAQDQSIKTAQKRLLQAYPSDQNTCRLTQ
jgi:hypothetical protein